MIVRRSNLKTLPLITIFIASLLLTACSNSPATNPAALAQLGKITARTDGTLTPTVGMASSTSFEQIQAAGKNIGKAMRTASIPADPNSPEALDRAERIGRGEIEEENIQATPGANDTASLHTANIDNCPVSSSSNPGMTLSAIPMGISECEMLSMRGKPDSVRRLSLPNEQRRILLSFKTKNGEMLYEFVDNRLATIY